MPHNRGQLMGKLMGKLMDNQQGQHNRGLFKIFKIYNSKYLFYLIIKDI